MAVGDGGLVAVEGFLAAALFGRLHRLLDLELHLGRGRLHLGRGHLHVRGGCLHLGRGRRRLLSVEPSGWRGRRRRLAGGCRRDGRAHLLDGRLVGDDRWRDGGDRGDDGRRLWRWGRCGCRRRDELGCRRLRRGGWGATALHLPDSSGVLLSGRVGSVDTSGSRTVTAREKAVPATRIVSVVVPSFSGQNTAERGSSTSLPLSSRMILGDPSGPGVVATNTVPLPHGVRPPRFPLRSAAPSLFAGIFWPALSLLVRPGMRGSLVVAGHVRRCPVRLGLWRGKDSNLRRQSHSVYSRAPLTAREPRRAVSECSDQAAIASLKGARARPAAGGLTPRRVSTGRRAAAAPRAATRASSACGSRSGGCARA